MKIDQKIEKKSPYKKFANQIDIEKSYFEFCAQYQTWLDNCEDKRLGIFVPSLYMIYHII